MGPRGVQEPVPSCRPGTWDFLKGLKEPCPLPGLFPTVLLTAAAPSPFLLPPAPPLSWGHFLMPFFNFAPIPPKSNQIHNLIRQKNEENVCLPASPLTGRRPEANLENVTTE